MTYPKWFQIIFDNNDNSPNMGLLCDGWACRPQRPHPGWCFMSLWFHVFCRWRAFGLVHDELTFILNSDLILYPESSFKPTPGGMLYGGFTEERWNVLCDLWPQDSYLFLSLPLVILNRQAIKACLLWRTTNRRLDLAHFCPQCGLNRFIWGWLFAHV